MQFRALPQSSAFPLLTFVRNSSKPNFFPQALGKIIMIFELAIYCFKQAILFELSTVS